MRASSLRRRLAVVAAALGVVGALAPAAGASTTTPAPSPWLQSDYNGAHSRANTAESILGAGTIGRVRLLRTIRSTQANCYGDADRGLAVPAFSESHVYLADGGTVASYVARTGALAWRAHVPGGAQDWQQIAVTHGLVILGGQDCVDNPPTTTGVYAFDTATGALAWTVHATGEYLVSMAASGKYLATDTGVETSDPDVNGDRTTVYRVQSGTKVWSKYAAPGCGVGGAFIVHGAVFDGSCTNGAHALQAVTLSTGAPLWSRAGRFDVRLGDSDGSDGRHVLVLNRGGQYVALDPRTGHTQYTLPGDADAFVMDRTRIYGECNGFSDVCAYDSGTGAKLWEVPAPASADFPQAEANGLLYLSGAAVLSASTGRVVATPTLDATAALVGQGRIGAEDSYGSTLRLYGLPGY